MSYKGAVLRGEKYFHLCPKTEDADKLAEIEIYKESKRKIKDEKAEAKSKGKK